MLPHACRQTLTALSLSTLFLSNLSLTTQAAPALLPVNSALYIAGRDGKAVLRCDGATGATLGRLGAGMDPLGLALGPDRNLYVVSDQACSVQRFRLSTGKAMGTFIPRQRGGLERPLMMAFGPDRSLYVGDESPGVIRRYDGRTGASLGVFVKQGSGGLTVPGDMAFGPDGNLYVINQGDILALPSNEVLRFNGKTGAPMGAFVRAGSGGLTEPNNLTFGPDGGLYVGGPTGVLQFDGKTGAFVRLFAAHDSRLGNVGGLAFGPDGDLYVSDWQKSDVVRYDGRTGAFKGVFASPSGLGASGGFGFGSRCILFGPRGAGGEPPVAAVSAERTEAVPEVVGAAQDSAPPLLAAGTTAPDFTALGRDGKPVRLSDYRGKTVVLDFWATWCGPCVASLPHTDEVARRFSGKAVVVLAVNVRDSQERFDGWLTKISGYDAITFARDWSRKFGADQAVSLYHVSGIPVQYVIDPQGKIVTSIVGYGCPTTDLADAITEAQASR